MTAEEALAAAEAEGLSLLRAENTTGYLNVSSADNYIHPYRAHFTHKMRKVESISALRRRRKRRRSPSLRFYAAGREHAASGCQ